MRQTDHEKIQEKHWDKIARKSRILKREEVPYPAIKEMEEFFVFMNLPKNSHILEIGCGTGRYTLPLLKLGHKILGTDLSRQSLDLLKKLALEEGIAKNLRVEQNSFEDEKLCKNYLEKFDCALLVAVIHHFNPEKREKIFRNIVRSVGKKGLVAAIEPNPLNPLYYCLYFWRWLKNAQNVNRWQTEKGMLYTNVYSLKRLFQKSGLGQIEVKRYAWLPSIFGNRFRFVLFLNDILCRMPLIKEFSAFIWIKGQKK